ncbi:MAG: diaminopimelate epimerase [Candidatus Lambdaproteobacteria bacterium]|nr:diaminopimelate epimerase [Candidatus Lambdaproteobacteria bacterium]
MTDYVKYHGLGNDYLVLEPRGFREGLTPQRIRLICDRHRGVGGDGILWGPLPPAPGADAALRIFNPDGSEAGKSGNGLRIFARHLWQSGQAPGRSLRIDTPGGRVTARILDEHGRRVSVDMGQVRFTRAAVPMTAAREGDDPSTETLGLELSVGGRTLKVNGAGIGNPHCVVLADDPSEALARETGPLIESHAWFPERTNVQFMQTLGTHDIRIEIWERGAGYTSASGSSSCAAAAVACRLGLCRSPVTVHMPGGTLSVALDEAFQATLEGAVAAVGSGTFDDEFLRLLGMTRA